ncbi:hypothetical protein LAG90_18545 [Marinilongibacter aquaticus]|uniref:beta strand repeat-containing protein n=1 Tax=Marinilongibacter aquaticus TaxID=2975157 RepID=UPI0021BD5673|nr:3-coathanger stack domain-containing protein [Marinilongibacter aquaticus]UBM58800.1 hypothetical protein LAG90_18545 [Marinilongibacter aquaticus]
MRKILPLLAFFFLHGPLSAQTFTNGPVATGYGSSNMYNNSAIGPDGKFYVLRNFGSFINSSNPQTPYFEIKRWDDGTWTSIGTFDQNDIPDQLVSSSYTMYGSGMGFDIDASGNFHVAINNYTSTDNGANVKERVSYGKSSDGNNWTFTELDNDNFVINYSFGDLQLELDQNDRPHVTSRVSDNSSSTLANRRKYIRHYYYNGSSWVKETVLTTVDVNDIPNYAFTLDKNGKAHIAAALESNGSGSDASLVYFNNVSGSWSSPTTVIAGSTGSAASVKMDIIIDDNIKAHILNRDNSFNLKYATNQSGSWNVSNLTTGSLDSESMSRNSAGDMFSFYNAQSSSTNSGEVRYAYKAHDSSTWTTGPVMTGNNNTGRYSSSKLSDGNVGMMWFDHYTGSGSPSYGPPNNPKQLQYATASFGPTCTAPSISVNPTNRNVCSGSNTTFSITATGATAYQWQVNTGSGFTDLVNGGVYSNAKTNTLSITGATSGMGGYKYRCVAMNGSASCFTNSNAATLSVTSISTSGSQTNPTCHGSSTGTASVTANGGSSPYTYSWAPSGGSAATASGLAAGTYTVTVTDNNGCMTTKSYSLVDPPALTASISSVTNIECNGASSGAATVSAGGGTPGYSYSWAPSGGSAATASGLAAGTYTVTVTDDNGCTKTASATITQPPALTATISSVTNIECNGASSGAATVSAGGGTPGYSYSWAPSGGSAATASGLAAGTYTVTVTDDNGCTKTASATITQPPALTATISSVTNIECNGASSGAATVSAGGGTPGYSYSWAPSGGSAATASGLAAGTYTVTVTDDNGCTKTASATITQPPALTATISSVTNIECNGASSGAATVSAGGGTPGYSYSWAPSGGSAATASGLAAGTYTVTVTDDNGCTKTASATITQPPALTATISSVTNIECNGASSGAATVSAGGGTPGYSYSWAPSGGSAATASGLAAGTYTVTVTDDNGCTKTASATITQPPALTATISSVTNIECNGASSGAATVSAGGGTPGYSYSWAPSGGSAATASGLAAGTYTVTVTDDNGCTKTASATITQPPALTATISSVTNIECNGASSGAATVSAGGGTPGYSYSWAPSGGSAATASGLAAGTYTVTVTDDNGCTKTASATITQPPALTATISSVTNIECNGASSGAATVSAGGGTPGYSYSWAPSGGSAATASGLAAGTYTVTVTDDNGCTKTASATITQPPALTATISSVTNIECNGASSGAATVSAGGGTPGYSYSWAPSGGSAATASGLAAGTYTVTVTDDNGCTKTASATITQPPALTATISSVTNIECNGASSGAATVSAGGGTPGYSYSWAPSGGSAATASGLAAGTYTVTVTDDNGCTKTASATITQPPALTATISSVTNIECNGASSGAATVSAGGGTPGYSYSWAPSGGSAATASGLAAGTYTVTVTDDNGCTKTASATITQPPALTATISSVTNIECNGASSGAATVSAGGGTPGYSYSWAPSGGSAATASGLAAGIYTVTVTDDNGCTKTASATITQPPLIEINLSEANTPTICGASDGSIVFNTANLSDGAYTLNYKFNGTGTSTSVSVNSNSFQLTGIPAGDYTGFEIISGACKGLYNSSVLVENPPLIITASNSGPYEEGSTIHLMATGGLTYTWNGPNNFFSTLPNPEIAGASSANAGIYSVTASNGYCTSTATTTVSVECTEQHMSYYLAYTGSTPEIIAPLSNNMQVQFNGTRKMSVVAITACEVPKIESVKLQLSGTTNNHYYEDNDMPYNLHEVGQVLSGDILVPNLYTFIARGYSQDNVQGEVLAGPDVIQFWVVNATRTLSAPEASSSNLCAGDNLTVNSSISGDFGTGNLYQAYLSDAQGNFGNPRLIGTSTDPENIPCQIPYSVKSSSHYRIKVASTSPIVSSDISTQIIEIIGPDLNLSSPNDDIINETGNRSAGSTIQASNKIDQNSKIDYRSGRYQLMEPGFEAKSGSVFKAIIQAVCPN